MAEPSELGGPSRLAGALAVHEAPLALPLGVRKDVNDLTTTRPGGRWSRGR